MSHVHEIITKMEGRIKTMDSRIENVTIHSEPRSDTSQQKNAMGV